MRILLVAPTCDGRDVGEAWVAYNWASGLAARHEVTLVTYNKRGRTPASQQVPAAEVVEWSEPAVFSAPERLNAMLKPGYVPFYFRARRWISRALQSGRQFDIAFQPTPVAMRYPSPVAGLGLPYVIGPLGGSIHSPPAFVREEGSSPLYTKLRRLDSFRLARDPLLGATLRGAECVLGIGEYVREALAGVPLRRFEALSETALLSAPESPPPTATQDGRLRLLFVGRLIRTKGARDAIRSMSLLTDLPVYLDIVGDGFDRKACEVLASTLGLGDRVAFHGWLGQPEVANAYKNSDVFFFPSYREPGGNVLFEAMGHGLPIVTSDRGGPGTWAEDSFSFKVTPTSPEAYARDLASAIRKVATDNELRTEMGDNARETLEGRHLWKHRLATVETLFNEIVNTPRQRATP